jgi:hypothetical protein
MRQVYGAKIMGVLRLKRGGTQIMVQIDYFAEHLRHREGPDDAGRQLNGSGKAAGRL